MNELSFTGINNVRVLRKIYKQWGPYPAFDMHVKTDLQNAAKHGEKHYKEIVLHCDLTDDANGNDLSEFKKIARQYEYKYINRNRDDHVILHLKRYDVYDNAGKVTVSNFAINEQNVGAASRENLPLFTYMAALTRKIHGFQSLGDEVKKCIALVNRSVHKTAMDFIENM